MARAIALRPSFILLDVPAAGLSPVELELVAEVCQNLARSGVGVLLIEHNVPMVLSLADTPRVTRASCPAASSRWSPSDRR